MWLVYLLQVKEQIFQNIVEERASSSFNSFFSDFVYSSVFAASQQLFFDDPKSKN